MITNYRRSLLFFSKLLLIFTVQTAGAQTISVGSDDIIRQLQLQGKLPIDQSLCARPYFTTPTVSLDSIYHLIDPNMPNGTSGMLLGKRIKFQVLPFTVATQFNSHHPYGWNQPDMIKAKGLQAVAAGGIYFSTGLLSVQLAPEAVFAANPNFESNIDYGGPTRGTYTHLFPGQSAIRLNAGAVSLGLSTENMWWGPGINNSLLMSNNAPGFLHLTFNSRRPLKTPIGSFEWQFVAGKLYEDTSLMLENKNLTTSYYNPATYAGDGYSGPYDPSKKWRYFNGFTITYQPKWMEGLFLGVSRIAYAYNDSLQVGDPSFLLSYFPTVFGIFRQHYAYGLDLPSGNKRYKQMASLHMRYVFPKSHAEIYGEYGWGDNQYNIRDFVLSVDHSRAYIAGVRKMVKLELGRWLDCQFEVTQLSQSTSSDVRSAGNWYGNQGGYTNQSRILGAGIGVGNNVQTVSLRWRDGSTSIGVKLESLQHDPIYHYSYWTDNSIGLSGQKRYGRVFVSAELQSVFSKNYIWEAGNNVFNLLARVKCTYRL